MGMSFNPMYQPVTTTTIKADGDMDISPYDLQCTDVYADTVEATEFVGGVGNFSSLTVSGGGGIPASLIDLGVLSYNGYSTYTFTTAQYTSSNEASFCLIASPIPFSGKVSLKTNTISGNTTILRVIGKNGLSSIDLTSTQTEYTISDAYSIIIHATATAGGSSTVSVTYGNPVFITS